MACKYKSTIIFLHINKYTSNAILHSKCLKTPGL